MDGFHQAGYGDPLPGIVDLALLSYPEPECDILFTKPISVDDIVWMGPGQPRMEMARRSGIETVEDIERLNVHLTKARTHGQEIHYLPPYQGSSLMMLAELLSIEACEVKARASRRLIEEVARQRSIKSDLEVAEIENALEVTARMHRAAMAATRPGVYEYEIAGVIQGIALGRNCQQAFNPITTVHGETLHNESCENLLEDGQLFLNDSGAESPHYYASDITRTYPVSGRFNMAQAEIYEIVLRAQLGAIEAIKPGISNKNVHLEEG